MKENALIEKSLNFATRIVKLYQYLTKTKKETILSKQVLRSGTSIGANINEANFGQSRADFIAKMHIALKEAVETIYWLKVLTTSEYINEKLGLSLLNDCIELKKLLVSTINTTKEN
ncbi:MAG: four helix bundle protein [Clostridia bacterium]|nr:four helix bundle protein [Clostridia bacterium]MBQ4586889.1 four helix bundle protein [Clostridia bacterium]MBQ6883480.1 four helix bundle protein [Clostridia bacterium]